MGSLQNLSFHREIELGVQERAEKEASRVTFSSGRYCNFLLPHVL